MRIAKVCLLTWLAALVGAIVAAPSPRAADETRAPQPSPTSCPMVTVSCPDTGSPNALVTFTANISGGDPAVTPVYKWTVPGYRILSGEDTSSITVESPTRGGTVLATVVIKGYDDACSITADCTTYFISDPGPDKIDEYGVIAVGDEKQRLDHFTDVLRYDPTAQGYLVCYGGRRSRADEAQRRCDRAKNFLAVSRGIEGSRLVTVDGGFRETPVTELWVVPSGLTPPSASPTVDPSEVRPPRPPRKQRRSARR